MSRNPVYFAIFTTIAKVLDHKKLLIKQAQLMFMVQILSFLIFLKMTIFSGNSVESSEFDNSVT